MGKEYLEKVAVLHGIIDEFANGFSVKMDPNSETLKIFYPSPEMPYFEIKKFIKQKVEVVVIERGQIIDLFPYYGH